MKEFDDHIPSRTFQVVYMTVNCFKQNLLGELHSLFPLLAEFVDFTEMMSNNITMSKEEASFALEAPMEIPAQCQASIRHRL